MRNNTIKGVIIFTAVFVAIVCILVFVIGMYPVLKGGVEVANTTNTDLASNFTGFSQTIRSYLWLPVVFVIGWIVYAFWHRLRQPD